MSDQSRRGGWDNSRSAAGNRNPWLVAVVVSIATFMVVLDTAIANVSLRYIAGSLAASCRWEGVGENSLLAGRHAAAAKPLQDAKHDQQAQIRRQPAQ